MAVIAIAVIVAVVLWSGFSLLLWALRCDENCSGDEFNDWRYTGQLWLALTGSVLTLATLGHLRSHHRGRRKVLLIGALASAITWWLWVLVYGGF